MGEIINTDDYFYEITDEGRGTIGYGCVSYKTAELIRRIHKQNKQLKRLEQENAELKEEIKQLHNGRNPEELYTLFGKPIKYWEELKAENERLKEENKTLEQFLSKEPLALQALQKGYASYKESTEVFYEMVKKYKKTLEEIKTIAEKYLTDCQGFKCEVIEEILQKLTKTEEE